LVIWILGKCFPKMLLVWHCSEKFGLWTHWIEDSNMKLLQVVSLKNSFYNSNEVQNSDLTKFNSSKFVHVSSLNFFDFRMFYMSWGIHRLQICSN
jgi:hypothetical protein